MKSRFVRRSLYVLAAGLTACASRAPQPATVAWSDLVADSPAPAPGSRSSAPEPVRPTPQGSSVIRPENRRNTKSRLEITMQGAGTSDERFRAGSGQLAGSVGYYVTERLLLAVRQNVSANKAAADGNDLWDGATRLVADYHFPQANVVPQVTPYLGINIGYIYGDSVTETMTAGPELGIKYFIKPDVFLQLGAEYGFTFRSSDRIDNAFENGSFFYGLGFGACF